MGQVCVLSRNCHKLLYAKDATCIITWLYMYGLPYYMLQLIHMERASLGRRVTLFGSALRGNWGGQWSRSLSASSVASSFAFP